MYTGYSQKGLQVGTASCCKQRKQEVWCSCYKLKRNAQQQAVLGTSSVYSSDDGACDVPVYLPCALPWINLRHNARGPVEGIGVTLGL